MNAVFLQRWVERVRRIMQRLVGRARRRALLARMRPADIVLASPRLRRLSMTALMYRLFLRARYVHSMLYIGDGRMLHTTARHGVVADHMPGKLFDRDSYAIYRVPDLTDDQRRRIVTQAQQHLDDKLDHAALVSNIPSRWFGLRSPLVRMEENRLWCSKLIVDAYRDAVGVELVPSKKSGTVTTEDLSQSDALIRL
jgi:cell wall-associated NlpC family hydrolase